MADTLELRLRSAWLTSLGNALQPLTPLSAFNNGDGQDASGELMQAGLLDVQGRVQAQYEQALTPLARPQRLSRLQFVSPPATLEYHAYFVDGESEPAAFLSTDDGGIVRWPADAVPLMGLVTEYVGVSSESDIPFTIELPVAEARVAIALVDMTRQHLLGHLAAEDDGTFPAVPADWLAARLTPESVHPNRIETAFRGLELGDDAMSVEQITAALQGLLTKDLVAQYEGDWYAAGALGALAMALMMISGVYRLDTASTETGALVAGRSVIVQGSRRSLLMMEHNQGVVSMGGLTAEGFAALMIPLFTNEDLSEVEAPESAPIPAPAAAAPTAAPGAQPAAPPVATAAAPATAPSFCGKCGTPAAPGTKFCGKCGNPMG